MESRFDALTKVLAGGMSRREALRRLGGLLTGAALAAVGLGGHASADPGHDCVEDCHQRYPPGRQLGACLHRCAVCDYSDPRYIGTSPEECDDIRFFCSEGYERFDDECGCGCQPV